MRLPTFLQTFQTALSKLADRVIPKSVTPNQITLVGLTANVLLCVIYASGRLSFGTFLISILATQIFDILDGGIARVRGLVSEQGKMLDQLSDTISAVIMLVVITYRTGLIDWWWIVILAVLYGIRYYLVKNHLDREYGGYKNALVISILVAFYSSIDLTLVVQFIALFNLLIIGFAVPDVQNYLRNRRKKTISQ